jgi:hypothetical protein
MALVCGVCVYSKSVTCFKNNKGEERKRLCDREEWSKILKVSFEKEKGSFDHEMLPSERLLC